MYHINSTKAVLVISQTMALFLTALSYPAKSQNLNLVDLNQANQFFSEGNKQFEEEIEQIGKTWKLPAIKLPQDYHQPDSINQSSSIDNRQQKFKPITEGQADSH
jgi:hypothetical protein